jgi:Mn-dependent DtxR family transcriptional regulator
MAMSENSKKVITYLQGIGDADVTAADVAAALGLEKKSVDGTFTALQKKEFGVRQPAQILDKETNRYVDVKFLKLTDAGKAFDVNAVVEA